MLKRIPCRVVRTKPLGKSDEVMRQASSLNNAYHKRDNVITRPPTYKSASRNLTYTDLVELTRASIDNGLTGQILDCYV